MIPAVARLPYRLRRVRWSVTAGDTVSVVVEMAQIRVRRKYVAKRRVDAIA
jgi:hypothetical protein